MEESSSLGVEDLEELQKDIIPPSKSRGGESGGGDSSSAANVDGAPSDSPNNTESSAITIDGKILTVDDVMEMKKKIDDLTLVNESRNKKIDEVRINMNSYFRSNNFFNNPLILYTVFNFPCLIFIIVILQISKDNGGKGSTGEEG